MSGNLDVKGEAKVFITVFCYFQSIVYDRVVMVDEVWQRFGLHRLLKQQQHL